MVRLYKIALTVFCLLFVLHTATASASMFKKHDYVITLKNAEINLSLWSVRAVGVDNRDSTEQPVSPKASEDAALLDARNNINRALKRLMIKPDDALEDRILIFDDVDRKIDELIKKNTIILKRARIKDSGRFEIIAEFKITGELLDFLFTKNDELQKVSEKIFHGRSMYTSIIFDASETDFAPILQPGILDDEGKPYHQLDRGNRSVAVKYGLVRYFRSLEDAKKSKFTGKRPYIIKDVKSDKYNPDYLVVPFNILEKVNTQAFKKEILKKCKVIIITK